MRVLVSVLCLTAGICLAAAPMNFEIKIKRGELTEAKASWWGFDKEDSTEFLQAAIDSGVKRLIVERMDTPWIVRPLVSTSCDQEIVFEKGCVLQAKRHEFLGRKDALLMLSCVTNVTLTGHGAEFTMWREDYGKPPYKKAEWRHTLSLRSCRNVTVQGLRLTLSGGDGICLGEVFPGGGPNQDITIRDCVCDRNYRQGISVCSVDGLLIENTVLSNTKGTPPEAGIDFEPDMPSERLTRIVMRNCLSENNNGKGFEFYTGHQVPGLSMPLSVRLENCVSRNDKQGFSYIPQTTNAIDGSIVCIGCVFESSRTHGIYLRNPADSAVIEFRDCLVTHCNPGGVDVQIYSMGQDPAPPGGITFENLRVVRPAGKRLPWTDWNGENIPTLPGISGVSGNVTIVTGEKTECFTLTQEWCAKNYPAALSEPFTRVPLDWHGAVLFGESGGAEMKLPSPLRLANSGRIVFHSEKAFVLTLRQSVKEPNERSYRKLRLCTAAGRFIREITMPGPEARRFTIAVPEPGFYALTFDVRGNALEILQAQSPFGVDLSADAQNFRQTEGAFFFHVPDGTERFAARVLPLFGAAVDAVLTSPSGKVAARWEAGMSARVFEIKPAESGLWKICVSKPPTGRFDNYSIGLWGIPAVLFPMRETGWRFGVTSDALREARVSRR